MIPGLKPAAAALLAIGLAGCISRTSAVQAPVATPAQPAMAGPSVTIPAPGARVRAVIASRAQARGTTIAQNTADGVVLEIALPQTNEALEAQCGPHQPGRKLQVHLLTRETGAATVVSEQRYVVDGSTVCPVTPTPEEVQQANASLQETRNQVMGVPPPQAAQPVAPPTPRT